jgi:hypothetical protein
MNETEALDLLRERMIGQRSDSGAQVVDVRYEDRINEDAEEYLRVVLILSDPPPGQVIWPIDEVHELRRRARVQLLELQIRPPFFVAFSYLPEPGELADDEAEVDA